MSRNQRRNRRNTSGASQNANRRATSNADDRSTGAVQRRSSTETKSSLRTTELIAYACAVLAVVMTALAVDAGGDGDDPFGAEHAIRYITYLTIGYMIARGLAKAGSYENRTDRAGDLADDDATGARAADDHGAVGDDEAAEQQDGEVETVDAPAVSSDERQHAERAKADRTP